MTVVDAELVEHVLHVLLHRSAADPQQDRDLGGLGDRSLIVGGQRDSRGWSEALSS